MPVCTGTITPLFVCADLLLHLDLLLAALLSVQLGPQTPEVLRLLRGIVPFTGNLLPLALVMVEALSVPGLKELVMCSGVEAQSANRKSRDAGC